MTAGETLLAVLVRATAVLLGGGLVGAAIGPGDARVRHRLWAATLGGALVAGAGGWLASLAGWHWDGGTILRTPAIPAHRPVATLLVLAWAVGMAVLVGRALRGLSTARRLAMAACPPTDASWEATLAEAAHALGEARPPRLLVSSFVSVPLTVGMLRPSIVLPSGCDGWALRRRRAVLLHEMAHVQRRDCAMELFVQLVCAVYWLHPGAWWVARRLRLAREQACDAAVLRTGTPAIEYAEHLVALLRNAASVAAVGVALGRLAAFEARLVALTHGTRPQAWRPARRLAAFAPLGLAILLGLWSPLGRAAPARDGTAHHAKAACACIKKHHRTVN